jgi:hypothetical protein
MNRGNFFSELKRRNVIRMAGLYLVGASWGEWRWGLVRTHERLKEIVSKYAPAK